ncbi:PREDICTED: nuclear factor NF-kappa-B p105 subunit isoform X1 [Cyprinodon variegatus]|uniref:nuclear factor NF-kappa-B p105 subunit isoform X1 n=1 Tax=Cyprinodon variegatus TaxID=28743 RepID=UPI0007429C24|nr:PREDICTED: nuclear factor NF-kappa-B p105 subunit isoform X1 [Cyprinodon variegatus]XP_015228770.1 PREDICTED: nuclear factor NF-kappa-B p105 subunit isoform X1 [Cyprinodon variegatus]XP_015228771.1 PREDICTED: nuclear factor NF-kappa-B p105 subunit isoform X1 [Cyprinodon variegatus]
MAADDHYLHATSQIFDTMLNDPSWELPHFAAMPHTPSLQSVDAPYLQILEQPKQRGFRFRYGCEGPSHGGLPGASSEKNRKTYPSVKICHYQGQARVVVQLVTAQTQLPQLHAHSLVGKQCDKGICIADLQSKDSIISFPNLGILHVTKKNVAKTLEERMIEAFRMGYNCGVSIHPEIDAQQGEVRVPRDLTEHQRSVISSAAANQAKEMDLSVVRLMFTAFLPDSDGGFSRRLEPVVSEPIYDSKAPNASNLKIVRMDRTAGCVTGGEEVYLLCDKVQKDDIQVRFYEEDESGLIWEALGDFSPTDVHRQFAIVFKTPKYRDQNLQKPTSVFVQLKRKSDNETSEPKPFTYHPQIIDKEEVQRKRQKTLPNFQDFSGHGGGGGLYRGGPATGGGPGSAGGGGYYQGYTSYNYGGGGGGGGFSTAYSTGLGGGGGMKHALQGGGVDDSDDDSDPDDDPTAGAVLLGPVQSEGPEDGDRSKDGAVSLKPGAEDLLMEATHRQLDALFRYSVTGDSAYLLAPQRPLMTAQDEDGDTGLHLAVLHSQQEALMSLTQVVSALTGEEVLNMRNHLHQTPLHLAVITQQKKAAEALLLAGADPTLTDRHGNTVLHLAAQQEGCGMVELLLQHKELRKLMESSNTAGLCAIHLAVLANRLQALRELLVGGANVNAQERSYGRTALHLATETDNVSLAGCLLLEGNAKVDCCTFNGSTPLHIAAGRGSVKLTALLMAAGADPQRENFEPLFFSEEEEECEEDREDDDDEGYVPGTTPVNMATSSEVLDLLNGKEYESKSQRAFVPPQGDLSSLDVEVKRAVCGALETEGCWENLAHSLGLGILNTAFRMSPFPAKTLLDSYEVSGGTISDLLAALRSAGECRALRILEEALCQNQEHGDDLAAEALCPQVQNLKLEARIDSGVCDSGVELSTA